MIRADHIYMWAITISVTLWRMHEGRMHQLWRMHRRHEIGQQIAFNSILDKILPACGSQLSSLFAHWADFLLSMALLIQKVTLILEDRGRVKRAEVALQTKESSCSCKIFPSNLEIRIMQSIFYPFFLCLTKHQIL